MKRGTGARQLDEPRLILGPHPPDRHLAPTLNSTPTCEIYATRPSAGVSCSGAPLVRGGWFVPEAGAWRRQSGEAFQHALGVGTPHFGEHPGAVAVVEGDSRNQRRNRSLNPG